MIIQENISFAPYTTFKIGGNARFFCIVRSVAELKQAVIFAKEKAAPFFILGGGSNILVSDAGFSGLVIKIEIQGKEVRSLKSGVRRDDSKSQTPSSQLLVSACAGESWDDFVEYTVKEGFNGLENLSAIPGTVGAAPVQNIGAYGVEVGRFISSVYAFDTQTMKEVEILGRNCHFGYRDSLFKKEKGRYIVTSVDFALKRDGKVNLEYRDLKEHFEKVRSSRLNVKSELQITPRQVREAVIDIRWNKLPDWNTWGTAGSFFKNPVISQAHFDELKVKYPGLPGFPEEDLSGVSGGISNGQVKIPLGWILDNVCNAKGLLRGGVGTYEKQALVIVTKPGATASEVVIFTQDLMKQVKEKTGITVEAEVEWVN